MQTMTFTNRVETENGKKLREWLKAQPSTISVTVQGFTFTTTAKNYDALRRNLETKSYRELAKLHAELYSTDKKVGGGR